MNAPTVMLRLSEVMRRTKKSRTTIYKEIAAGKFPKQVKDGATSKWVESEIEAYNQALIEQRDMGREVGTKNAA